MHMKLHLLLSLNDGLVMSVGYAIHTYNYISCNYTHVQCTIMAASKLHRHLFYHSIYQNAALSWTKVLYNFHPSCPPKLAKPGN